MKNLTEIARSAAEFFVMAALCFLAVPVAQATGGWLPSSIDWGTFLLVGGSACAVMGVVLLLVAQATGGVKRLEIVTEVRNVSPNCPMGELAN